MPGRTARETVVKRNEAGGARVVARGVIRGPEAGDEAVLESSSQGEVLRLEDYQIAPTKLLSTYVFDETQPLAPLFAL
jgi:hypothetical protein